MDIIQVFSITILFFIGIYIILRLIVIFFPDIIVALLTPFFVDIAMGIGNSIQEALEDAERNYPKYVYNNYHIYDLKKKCGLLQKTEQFVWNDNIEDERVCESFRFVIDGAL